MNDTNLTAEELLISACIDAKRDTLSDIMAAVTEDDFFFPGTKQLFRLFKSMYLSGEEITAESVVKLHAKDLELCHLRLSSVELVTAYGRWCIAFEQSYEQTGSSSAVRFVSFIRSASPLVHAASAFSLAD